MWCTLDPEDVSCNLQKERKPSEIQEEGNFTLSTFLSHQCPEGDRLHPSSLKGHPTPETLPQRSPSTPYPVEICSLPPLVRVVSLVVFSSRFSLTFPTSRWVLPVLTWPCRQFSKFVFIVLWRTGRNDESYFSVLTEGSSLEKERSVGVWSRTRESMVGRYFYFSY